MAEQTRTTRKRRVVETEVPNPNQSGSVDPSKPFAATIEALRPREGDKAFAGLARLLGLGGQAENQQRVEQSIRDASHAAQTGLAATGVKQEGAVDALTQDTIREAEFERQRGEDITALSQQIDRDSAQTSGNVATVRGQLFQQQADLQEKINQSGDQLAGLPDAVRDEFQSIRDQFSDVVSGAVSDIRGDRDAALAQVFQGQSQAMSAAVQGIQGNVNTQIAQINSNPNLTDAQRQQMISQVRMTGAMQMGPTIGATQLQFNQLAADTATKFGSFVTQLEGAGIAGQAQLGTAQGQAFTQASIAAGQLGNELLSIEANSGPAFAAAQSQLLGLESQAEMTGNQIQASLVRDLQGNFVPFSDPTMFDLQSTFDLMKFEAQVNLGIAGTEASMFAAQAMAGNPWLAAAQTAAQFGGAAGAGAGLLVGLSG